MWLKTYGASTQVPFHLAEPGILIEERMQADRIIDIMDHAAFHDASAVATKFDHG